MKTVLRLLISAMILCPTISIATTLTGVVVDAEKSIPIAGGTVSVDVLIPDSISFNTLSDTTGMYTLSDIPVGNAIYVIRCYLRGFAPFYMRYDALALGDRQVDILMYPQPETPPGGGGEDSTSISGVVLYETPGGARNPVEQGTVTLRSDGDLFSSHTGTDGKYLMRLRRGSYSLTVDAPKYETLAAAGVTVDSTGLTLNILLKATVTGVSPGLDARPEGFALGNAYPNPFNPKTVVSSQLPVSSYVRLVVYDLLGREVAVLVDGQRAAGSYRDNFNAGALASGVYVYRLTAGLPDRQAGSFVQSRTMVLLK